MKTILYCAICAMCLGSALALDGNGYLKNCKTYLRVVEDFGSATWDEALQSGVCIGYIGGVVETAKIWQEGTEKPTFCLPEPANPDQFIRVSIKYIEDNPAELHYNAAILVQIAFREAFPCTEGD